MVSQVSDSLCIKVFKCLYSTLFPILINFSFSGNFMVTARTFVGTVYSTVKEESFTQINFNDPYWEIRSLEQQNNLNNLIRRKKEYQ